ncbi:hypothetical protein BATDEDRAFT_34435 [Batrachochytrium dendrobatidis JAM81]|uniref:DDB1- and CUL4-associated factor 12 beta-propeller domain-containing protein n=1 Tax=Batrachochytrium dendrobatidis (strain JAM81 / FGSC 10211) TaxID=684364 RepID=F4NWA4_BATDJ|nr:uncharacterized protein BATDEDRAFT_34435 [Batrachochytrium dendrobatidis JAM81]EGF82796.1 hypothetical protein BATDEDRAFT_34435 [Batrachochytrium dendrobatidis JAM81]KAJ8328120.1 hypothetical protein O5D80_003493 [Batrachochytrium dendrobatidis]KAK5673188.1 hypothetical protein QVD99_000641 [Batrachochytrium dendrobatidis]|eukprot:XP_006676800.1 hypothetical protein BATDEDRAFT_34435 [Batrachochytrium dendrobatidis JAM81]
MASTVSWRHHLHVDADSSQNGMSSHDSRRLDLVHDSADILGSSTSNSTNHYSSDLVGHFKRFTTRRIEGWKYPSTFTEGPNHDHASRYYVEKEPCNVVDYLKSREMIASHRNRPQYRHRPTMDAITIDARSDPITIRCPDCKCPRYSGVGSVPVSRCHSPSPQVNANSSVEPECLEFPPKTQSTSPIYAGVDWASIVKPLTGALWPVLDIPSTIVQTPSPINSLSDSRSDCLDLQKDLDMPFELDNIPPSSPSDEGSTTSTHGDFSSLLLMERPSFVSNSAADKKLRCATCSAQMRLGMHENFMSAGESRLSSFVTRHLPVALSESAFLMENTDKIFASAWLSDSSVVLGTKCNKLQVLDVDSGKRIDIPTFAACNLIPQSKSSQETASNSARGLYQPFSTLSLQQQRPLQSAALHHCAGIHSISINPSNTLIAVGGGDPTNLVQIYHLPTFEPYALLKGHTDVVFSVAWLDDTTLVSGSRDAQFMHWSLNSLHISDSLYQYPLNHFVSVYSPLSMKKEHMGKVRDLKYDHHLKHAFTLSSDGFVKVWDVAGTSCKVSSSIPLHHSNETVCLALDTTHHLIAVGSQNHVSLLDPRIGSVVHMFESSDEGWGVRSLCMDRDTVTVGGGLGRISFYDLRAQKYLSWRKSTVWNKHSTLCTRAFSRTLAPFNDHLPVNSPELHGLDFELSTQIFSHVGTRTHPTLQQYTQSCQPDFTQPNHSYLQSGKGWLHRDEIYTTHFQGVDISNAVYTLSYNSKGNRLFTAGGPLQLNLRGSYAGVWQ